MALRPSRERAPRIHVGTPSPDISKDSKKERLDQNSATFITMKKSSNNKRNNTRNIQAPSWRVSARKNDSNGRSVGIRTLDVVAGYSKNKKKLFTKTL